MELVFSIPINNELDDITKDKDILSIILDDLTFMCNHTSDDGLFTSCPLAAKCPFIAIGNFSKDCSEITKDDWKPYVSFKQ